jgi:hypothetical protein
MAEQQYKMIAKVIKRPEEGGGEELETVRVIGESEATRIGSRGIAQEATVWARKNGYSLCRVDLDPMGLARG